MTRLLMTLVLGVAALLLLLAPSRAGSVRAAPPIDRMSLHLSDLRKGYVDVGGSYQRDPLAGWAHVLPSSYITTWAQQFMTRKLLHDSGGSHREGLIGVSIDQFRSWSGAQAEYRYVYKQEKTYIGKNIWSSEFRCWRRSWSINVPVGEERIASAEPYETCANWYGATVTFRRGRYVISMDFFATAVGPDKLYALAHLVDWRLWKYGGS